MSIILEEIALIIGTAAPVKTKDVPHFVRRARLASRDLQQKYPDDVKAYLKQVQIALAANETMPIPEDFVESDEEETDTELEEARYFAQTRIRGLSSVIGWNFSYILERKRKGTLIVPAIQRRYVWKKPARQQFVDGLINNLLKPHFIFARDIDDEQAPFVILDGLQRITTLEDFVNDKIAFSEHAIYGNKKFSQLPASVQDAILSSEASVNQTICEPRHWPGIFRLINKGGMPLNSMEIRRAIFPHDVLNALNVQSDESKLWHGLYGRNNRRYAGLEVMVRAVAMHYGYEYYEKPMESYLNWFCQHLDDYKIDPEVLTRRIHKMLMALFIADQKKIFKVQSATSSVINKSLVDCIFHAGLLLIEKHGESIDNATLSAKIVEVRNRLLANPETHTALTKTTSDKGPVLKRMAAVQQILSEIDK